MAKVETGMAFVSEYWLWYNAHNADGQREFVLLTMVPSR
jgi:hypothetical protein